MMSKENQQLSRRHGVCSCCVSLTWQASRPHHGNNISSLGPVLSDLRPHHGGDSRHWQRHFCPKPMLGNLCWSLRRLATHTFPTMDVDHGLLLEHSKKSSLKYLLDILDTDPSDSPQPHSRDLTLALLAAAVYSEKKPREADQANRDRLVLLECWRLLMTGSNPGLLNEYFGAAFINTGLQQVVVAHRDTILTKVGALYTDFKGILINKYTSCMNSLITFVDYVSQVIHIVNSKLENFKRRYNLTITGHSFVGWLVQVTTVILKYVKVFDGALMKNTSAGVHAETVVFDSPGAKKILHKLQDKHSTRYGTGWTLRFTFRHQNILILAERISDQFIMF